MLKLGVDFEVLFSANPQPLLIFDPETLQVLNVNEAACAQYGYCREDFLQLTVKDIRPANEIEALNEALKDLSGDRMVKQSFTHLRNNGEIINVEVLSYAVMHDGKPARLVVPIDVTERLLNKHRLETALAKMENTLESISDGHFTLSRDGTVYSWNKAAEQLTGVSRENMLHQNFWQMIPLAAQSAFYTHFLHTLVGEEPLKFEEYFSDNDKWFYTSMRKSDEGVDIYFQDITEIKRQQKELKLKNQRLEEVAYFNSHELRRPVANIMGLYHLLHTADQTSCTDIREIIDKIMVSCRDIDAVIQRIDQAQPVTAVNRSNDSAAAINAL